MLLVVLLNWRKKMLDKKLHIVERGGDDSLNDWIHYLLRSYDEGKRVLYAEGNGTRSVVDCKHVWNFERYSYRVIKPREYIIHVSKNDEVSVVDTVNCWTRSDFGKDSDGGEHILMREVNLYEE